MTKLFPYIRLQSVSDAPQLTKLHEHAFGPGRFTRTAYRLREAADSEPRLNLCAVEGEILMGAVQFTPICVNRRPRALLLGPLVIADTHKNQGWGLKLMLEGLDRAQALGYRLVLLVGDEPYYAKAGFRLVPKGAILMPGPVDPSRLLYKELEPGVLTDFHGVMQGWRGGRA